ncbi:MAG: beta strand repeat-containing protein [Phycisphaerales bacterium]
MSPRRTSATIVRSAGLCLGILAASAASHAGVIRSWALPVDGNWSVAANWSPIGIPSATDIAELALDDPYTVTVPGGAAAGISIPNAMATLALQNGLTLTVFDAGVDNDGTIIINATAGTFTTIMDFAATASIGGAGSILLNGGNTPPNARLTTAKGVTITHGADHTINATIGQILGSWINHGDIIGSAANQNLFRIEAAIDQTAGGRIIADSGFATLFFADITGGTIETINGGTVTVSNATSIDGVTNLGSAAIENGADLTLLGGGLTNNGSLVVNRTAGSFTTVINAVESATINGPGTITLNGGNTPPNARITADAAATITHGAEHTITATIGQILGSWINHGEIIGSAANANLFRIEAAIDQSSGGRIIADAGFATLFFADIIGGTLETANGGTVTVSNATSIDGVTNLGSAAIENGADLTLLGGGLTNNGSLVVNRTAGVFTTVINAVESATINGPGTISLNGGNTPPNARITTAPDATLTHAAEHTITATIGQILGNWINHGEIIGSAAGPGGFRIEATIDQTTGGRIIADAGFATLYFADITGGTLETASDGTIAVDATATADAVTNLGALAIENGASLGILSGGLINDGTITINRTGGVFNTILDAPAAAAITGDGLIILNAITATGDARIAGDNAEPLSIGPGQTIEGSGFLLGLIDLAGILRPGGALARIDVGATIDTLPTAALRIALEGEGPLPRLTGLGAIDIADATLDIAHEPYAPTAFFRGVIVDGLGYTGAFAARTADALTGGRVWRIVYVDADTIDIAATCPADLTADGSVDSDDLGSLLGAFGQSGLTPYSGADADGDGDVDSDDLGTLLSAFGSGC